MKLTNSIRDAFVRAAMQDVPKIEYDEQKRKIEREAAIDLLPPKVRALAKDKELAQYLYVNYHGLYCARGASLNLSPETLAKTREISGKESAQSEARRELQSKLKAAAYSATTRKQLAEMLPEFERYLPVDEAAANRSVPVVANLVAEFTKAGWPKGKSPDKRA